MSRNNRSGKLSAGNEEKLDPESPKDSIEDPDLEGKNTSESSEEDIRQISPETLELNAFIRYQTNKNQEFDEKFYFLEQNISSIKETLAQNVQSINQLLLLLTNNSTSNNNLKSKKNRNKETKFDLPKNIRKEDKDFDDENSSAGEQADSERETPFPDDDLELLNPTKINIPETPARNSFLSSVADRNRDTTEEARRRLSELPKKRKSFIIRGIQEAERAATDVGNEVRMTKVQPSYSHITLTQLKAQAVMQFYDEIIDFETGFQTSIFPVANLIIKPVRREIASRTENIHTEYSLLRLTLLPLMALLIKFTAPTSQLDFWENLSTIPKFPDLNGYRPSIINFVPWYRHMLSFIADFRRTFEFLSESYDADTEAELIPLCNNRENGIVKLFCSMVPYEYATKIVNSWKTSTFANTHAFLSKFGKELQIHYANHLLLVKHRLHFGGTSYAALFSKQRNVQNDFKAKQKSSNGSYRFANSNQRYSHSQNVSPHRLHYMPIVTEQAILEELEDELVQGLDTTGNAHEDEFLFHYEDTSYYQKDYQQVDDDEEIDQLSEYDAREQQKLLDEIDDAQQDSADLNALDNNFHRKSDTQERLGCFIMMITGRCPKGSACRFSHHPNALATARDAQIKKLASMKYGSASTGNTNNQAQFRPPVLNPRSNNTHQHNTTTQNSHNHASSTLNTRNPNILPHKNSHNNNQNQNNYKKY